MYKVNQKTAPDAFALRSPILAIYILKINLYLTSVTKKEKSLGTRCNL